jgi:hypothetical protein
LSTSWSLLGRQAGHDFAGTIVGPAVCHENLESARRRFKGQDIAQAGLDLPRFVVAGY